MRINTNASITSGENISYWISDVKPLAFKKIDKDITTEVLVIGGGIAGLTTAYCLLQSGRKVALVEDGLIGSGETGRTTAHLTAALDDRYYEIEKTFGEEKARMAAESHLAAIDFIEQTIEKEHADCHFERVDGFLFLHPADKLEHLQQEFQATKKLGLNTGWLNETHGITGYTGPCIRFPRQGQFHIMRYLEMLAGAIQKMGGEIYTDSRAEKISKDGANCNGHHIRASHIVVATNTPVNDLVTMHTKQFPYRTYVIAAQLPKGRLPHALWWDTGDSDSKWITWPYHYVRLERYSNEYDLLIVGGEDHKTGQADDEGIREEDRYDNLVQWAKEHFPEMGDVVHRWSGQVMEPVDYMGFIGKNPGDDNIYIITGDSGNGMTHGTIGGILLADLINGRENKWAELYSPKRIPVKVPGTFLSEVLNMAKQYGDYLTAGDIEDAQQLPQGEGAILKKGLKKFAVYRDEQDELHVFSAVCPHLGCILQWNGDEKSFGCPCHGSRFSKLGELMNGPAVKGLEKLKLKT